MSIYQLDAPYLNLPEFSCNPNKLRLWLKKICSSDWGSCGPSSEIANRLRRGFPFPFYCGDENLFNRLYTLFSIQLYFILETLFSFFLHSFSFKECFHDFQSVFRSICKFVTNLTQSCNNNNGLENYQAFLLAQSQNFYTLVEIFLKNNLNNQDRLDSRTLETVS